MKHDDRCLQLVVGIVLLTTAASTLVIASEDENLRFESLLVASAEGSDSPLVECYVTSTMSASSESRPIDYANRMLCNAPDGSFVVLTRLNTETGEEEFALVDPEDEQWIRLSLAPEFEGRSPDESRDEWFSRMTEAEASDYVVHLESSTRLFESVDAEVIDSWRSGVWDGLRESDPEIAARVVWILENLKRSRRPYLRELIRRIEDFVYAGPRVESREINEEITLFGTFPINEAAMPDIEKEFGKWGAFPDWPRALDE